MTTTAELDLPPVTLPQKQTEGHAAHSKIAPSTQGLPGTMPRPIKMTLLGAGSGFTPTLLKDVLRIPGNEAGGTIALVDVDVDRLTMMHQVIRRLLEVFGQSDRWTVEATTERCQALPGSHYVTNCIEVAGLACVRHDNDIPARYGVDQCIGDTIGPGGLFKALRTVPVFLDVLRDVERLCPEAIVLNYTNPMAMMCLAAARAVPSVSVVGLCHSVQGTSDLLAKRAGVPYSELQWECAGINHLAWFTRLEHQGRDLYPMLMQQARRELTDPSAEPEKEPDLIRKDMMLNFGAFITESSGHLSEYLPYYRKRKDLLARYARPGYDGQTSFYADNWPKWRGWADVDRGEAGARRGGVRPVAHLGICELDHRGAREEPALPHPRQRAEHGRVDLEPAGGRLRGGRLSGGRQRHPADALRQAARADGRPVRLEHGDVRPRRHGGNRAQQGSRHSRADAGPVDGGGVFALGDPGDGGGVVHGGSGVPAWVPLGQGKAHASKVGILPTAEGILPPVPGGGRDPSRQGRRCLSGECSRCSEAWQPDNRLKKSGTSRK